MHALLMDLNEEWLGVFFAKFGQVGRCLIYHKQGGHYHRERFPTNNNDPKTFSGHPVR